MCSLFLSPKPQEKPITSIPQYIFAYPVKNKIQNLSKLLLLYWEAIKTGNLGKWRFPLSFLSSFHRKWHERFAQIALLHWPQSRQRKTTLRMRQFIFVTGSLLTIPQNSQPQTTESLTRELCSVSDFGIANSTRQSLLKNKDHSHAHIVKWAGANLAQSCTPSE